MMTVKMGAELFTVSANDTATFFRLTKPRTTVVNLTKANTMNSLHVWSVPYLLGNVPFQRQEQPPHESNKQHDHDEVGRVLGSRLVLVKAAGNEHLQAAYEGGGEHLDCAWGAEHKHFSWQKSSGRQNITEKIKGKYIQLHVSHKDVHVCFVRAGRVFSSKLQFGQESKCNQTYFLPALPHLVKTGHQILFSHHQSQGVECTKKQKCYVLPSMLGSPSSSDRMYLLRNRVQKLKKNQRPK